jgi:hypothetical protein
MYLFLAIAYIEFKNFGVTIRGLVAHPTMLFPTARFSMLISSMFVIKIIRRSACILDDILHSRVYWLFVSESGGELPRHVWRMTWGEWEAFLVESRP